MTRTATVTVTATAKAGQAQTLDASCQSSDALKGIAMASAQAAERGIMAFPNPARDYVTFVWQKSDVEKARIEIYNLSGERVAEVRADRANHALWTTDNTATGIYFYQTILTIRGQEEKQTIKKIVVVK
jgi:hypothetical protein